jgi:hypothetical protein
MCKICCRAKQVQASEGVCFASENMSSFSLDMTTTLTLPTTLTKALCNISAPLGIAQISGYGEADQRTA